MKLTYHAESITNNFKGLAKTYNDYYKFECVFAQKDLPKNVGFWWNPPKKMWWTPFEETAAKLADYAGADCKDRLMHIKSDHDKALEESRAIDAIIEIPVNEGLAYLPFQKAGIAFSQNHRNILIADEMGFSLSLRFDEI